ncbi:MAG: polysaccharide biosynthesis/export family protein [Pyrinomonadaceae bacterium]
MKVKAVLLFILSFGLFQAAFGQEIVSVKDAENERGYLIGPGDKLSIKVLGEPDFNSEPRIDEDGKFQVPYFNDTVYAKCRTEKELRSDVAQLLSKYLKNPQVSVSVVEQKSRPPAVIIGAVVEQQKVDLHRRATLLELISVSGGVTEEAGGLIQIFRTQPLMCAEENEQDEWLADTNNGMDVPSRIYSLGSLQRGSTEANPEVHPGDIIVVQKASPVYITGEVLRPQGIRLTEGGLTLTQAIAMVGGVNRRAKTKDITIYRLKNNSKQRETISVNYDLIKEGKEKDPLLEPYDIIEVDKTKKSIAQIAFEVITGAGRTGITAVTQGLGTRVLY